MTIIVRNILFKGIKKNYFFQSFLVIKFEQQTE